MISTSTLKLTELTSPFAQSVFSFYQANYPSGRPRKKEQVLIVSDADQIVAAVKWKPLSQCVFLSGLSVAASYRGLWLDTLSDPKSLTTVKPGHWMLLQLQQHLNNDENLLDRPLISFVESELVSYYQQIGFREARMSELMGDVQKKLQRLIFQGRVLQPIIWDY